LNEKNIKLITEKQELQEKYEKEIDNINSNFKKKELEYQLKISNFSSFNENSFKNKIESDIVNQYEEKLLSKDQNILELNKIIDKLKQDNELISDQFQFEKEGLLKDINTFKNLHKTETLDLIQRIQILKNENQKEINNEQISRIKNELEINKHQINVLSSENLKLKRENEELIKEKNRLKSNYLVLEGKVKLEEKKNETEIKILNNRISNLQVENNHLLNSNKEKENEIKKLYNEKTNLSNKLSYKELECQQLINQINVLNDLLKNHQDELENNLKENYKIKKENLLKEKLNEESYKKEIEDLQSKLKGNINFEKIEEIISDKDKEIYKLKKKIKEIQNSKD
jgi:hypothetical protein